MEKKLTAMDGNTATTHSAHATNEVIAIYPITPSSNMGEIADEKSASGEKNIWGTIPSVTEMQSEGGASGAVHGALTAGALTTTFTASQGLLLMIPNMFKIAGELTSSVFHVSARTVATHALSIFGDHSDVMACRSTGFALLASNNPQEAMDMALIAQRASLETRVPFLHFFDGFRTSHELNMVNPLTREQMRRMLPDELIKKHKELALNPEKPFIRGTAQNPDVFFQARETVNKFYDDCPDITAKAMEEFGKITGRKYNLFDYFGAKDAEHIIVIMASGADVTHETVSHLLKEGEKVGVVKVRLYRPFDIKSFIDTLPATTKTIAALDRTKEPGAIGEPLYADICAAFLTKTARKKFKTIPKIIGGRYGLSSKDFTPAMVKAVYENLKSESAKNHFTVGIKDDVTNTSLNYDQNWDIPHEGTYQAMFYGLGSDGTVGANKNTMKIISEQTDNFAQGYFVYDSKKAGSMTISHVRFGKHCIRSAYLISKADFTGIHQFSFLEKYDMLSKVKESSTVLLNSSPYKPEEIWDKLPMEFQQDIINKKLKLYAIDAASIADKTGMGARINTIMQSAFFAISGVLDKDTAIKAIKDAIKKTYLSKGQDIVDKNFASVDAALSEVKEIKIPAKPTSKIKRMPAVPADSPQFVKNVTGTICAFKGDDLPVSAFTPGGIFPSGTARYEKRNIALHSPVWEPAVCIQCGICSLVCPHAAIRIKAYDAAELEKAPEHFKSTDGKFDLEGNKFTVQVAVEDCTGCGSCVYNCPAYEKDDKGQKTGRKAINMHPQVELRKTEIENFGFFLSLREKPSPKLKRDTIKGSQLVTPLFEFSGACAGCGETPYIKLLTQLFGDHLAIANATGCSSIYGGNLPTTPYTVRKDGRGPVWSNSLFEDNAEFGMGMRLAYDKLNEEAVRLLSELGELKEHKKLVDDILSCKQSDWVEMEQQRGRITDLKKILAGKSSADCRRMLSLADYLLKKSVWIVGGDGWAYDIGYGGLDHVLASQTKVRALVLDTEVYSNTGGQMSKATPLGAVAAFAAGGKPMPKKDLGMIAMTYGNIYVAQIAMGANYQQSVKALAEAESYEGSSLVIAYSHCIAHGINMTEGMNEQKKAVACGRWPIYRFNPNLIKQGKNPLTIDGGAKPTISVEEYMKGENRFRQLMAKKPDIAKKLLKLAEEEYKWRLSVYRQIATMSCDVSKEEQEQKERAESVNSRT